MRRPNSTLATLVVVAIMAVMAHAETASARIIRLWYFPTGAPLCCTDNAQMERVILQAAREFEAHSFGSVKLDWRGTTLSPPCGFNSDDVVVWWDPALPGPLGACGQMLRGGYGCFQLHFATFLFREMRFLFL